jgi:ribose transport system permease protein
MKKSYGIIGLWIVICVTTSIINPQFLTAYNLQNTLRWSSLFAIISIGAAFVIITGGIDLSIGSVIGLVGSLLPWLMVERGWSVPAALITTMLVSLGIGLFHGLLITKMRLQPFIVTLCGLLFYRGFARWLTGDQTMGFKTDYEGLRNMATFNIPLPFTESFAFPISFVLMLTLAVAAAVVLNHTIFGRYMLALGRNEEAARYSGINTDRMIIMAYVICSLAAGFGGILFALDVNSVQPASFGSFYELYAIAAAVLGGCSLRGGQGSILGVVIGAAVMRVLYNAINLLRIPTTLEFSIIGIVILGGVIVDELARRYAERRRTSKK